MQFLKFANNKIDFSALIMKKLRKNTEKYKESGL